jgi:hypothetical protein
MIPTTPATKRTEHRTEQRGSDPATDAAPPSAGFGTTPNEKVVKTTRLLAVFADGTPPTPHSPQRAADTSTPLAAVFPLTISPVVAGRDTNQPTTTLSLVLCSAAHHEQGYRVIGNSSFTTSPADDAGACAEGGDSRVSQFGLGEIRI